MKIRIINHAVVRLALQPGDELDIQSRTPELENLLASERADGAKFAELVSEDDDLAGAGGGSETATVSAVGRTATTGRGQRREPRPQTVPQ